MPFPQTGCVSLSVSDSSETLLDHNKHLQVSFAVVVVVAVGGADGGSGGSSGSCCCSSSSSSSSLQLLQIADAVSL